MPSFGGGRAVKQLCFFGISVNYLLPSTEPPETMEHFSCGRKMPISGVCRIKSKNLLRDSESSACMYCSLHELPVTLLWIPGIISISLVSWAAGYISSRFWDGKEGVDLLAVRTSSLAESRSTAQLNVTGTVLWVCAHFGELWKSVGSGLPNSDSVLWKGGELN